MKRGLYLLLLLGALIGLLGQETAFATVPPTTPASTASAPMTMAGMTEDCMKMMQQQPEGKPCKGMTLDCIAAMGCIVPVVLLNAPVPPTIAPQLFTTQTFWPTTPILAGSDLAPEPPPPTRLG